MRALRLVDRAETAKNRKKAARRLTVLGRLLGKMSRHPERLGGRGRLTPDCETALAIVLADGRRRVTDLETGL